MQSQDQIWTMSGKVIDCKVISDIDYEIVYEISNKRGKTKEVHLHKSEIFSVSKAGNEPEILYQKVEELGDWMEPDEMKVYIIGEQDARKNYDTKFIEIAGTVVGAGFSYMSKGSFVAILLGPAIYTGIQFIPLIKIKEEHITDKSFAFNDFYLKGFEPVARTKRVMSALKSSFIGAAIGIIFYAIVPLNWSI